MCDFFAVANETAYGDDDDVFQSSIGSGNGAAVSGIGGSYGPSTTLFGSRLLEMQSTLTIKTISGSGNGNSNSRNERTLSMSTTKTTTSAAPRFESAHEYANSMRDNYPFYYSDFRIIDPGALKATPTALPSSNNNNNNNNHSGSQSDFNMPHNLSKTSKKILRSIYNSARHNTNHLRPSATQHHGSSNYNNHNHHSSSSTTTTTSNNNNGSSNGGTITTSETQQQTTAASSSCTLSPTTTASTVATTTADPLLSVNGWTTTLRQQHQQQLHQHPAASSGTSASPSTPGSSLKRSLSTNSLLLLNSSNGEHGGQHQSDPSTNFIFAKSSTSNNKLQSIQSPLHEHIPSITSNSSNSSSSSTSSSNPNPAANQAPLATTDDNTSAFTRNQFRLEPRPLIKTRSTSNDLLSIRKRMLLGQDEAANNSNSNSTSNANIPSYMNPQLKFILNLKKLNSKAHQQQQQQQQQLQHQQHHQQQQQATASPTASLSPSLSMASSDQFDILTRLKTRPIGGSTPPVLFNPTTAATASIAATAATSQTAASPLGRSNTNLMASSSNNNNAMALKARSGGVGAEASSLNVKFIFLKSDDKIESNNNNNNNNSTNSSSNSHHHIEPIRLRGAAAKSDASYGLTRSLDLSGGGGLSGTRDRLNQQQWPFSWRTKDERLPSPLTRLASTANAAANNNMATQNNAVVKASSQQSQHHHHHAHHHHQHRHHSQLGNTPPATQASQPSPLLPPSMERKNSNTELIKSMLGRKTRTDLARFDTFLSQRERSHSVGIYKAVS